MSVYAVASGKGGVGKTTTAVALGACMAATGRRTVVVDADLGMPDLGAVLGIDDDRPTLHDVLAGDAAVGDAIRSAPGGFDVVVGGAALEDYARGDPAELRTVIETLASEYDEVVLDTAAGLSQDVLVPLGLADRTILVATAADAALQDAEKTRQLVDRVGGTVAGIVVTRVVDVDTSEAGSTSTVTLLGMVPEDDSVRDAEQANEPITTYAPDGPAGSAYIEVTAALLGVAVGEVVAGGAQLSSDREAVPFAGDRTDEAEGSGAERGAPTEPAETDDGSLSEAEQGEGPLVETDDEPENQEESSRSLLNRLTGGLIG